MSINVAALSYALGGIAYVVLAVLLGTAWRGRLQGALLLVTTIVSALWCIAHAAYANGFVTSYLLLALLEIARDALWLLFLLQESTEEIFRLFS